MKSLPRPQTPFLSVFIPVYNGERYLEQTIKSVLASSFCDFEVLIVDDGSTDDSLHLLTRLAEQDVRLHVWAMPNVGTVPRNWNRMKHRILGEYVLYLSQDDLIEPDLFENFVKRQALTDADIIVPELKEFYSEPYHEPDAVVRQRGLKGDFAVILSGVEALKEKLKGNIPNGFCFYRSGIRKAYSFDETLFNSDDLSAYEHLLQAKKVAFCQGAVIYRMSNPNAITKKPSVIGYTGMLMEDRLRLLRKQYLPETFKDALRRAVLQLLWGYYRYLDYRSLFSKENQITIENYFRKSCQNKLKQLTGNDGWQKFLMVHSSGAFFMIRCLRTTGALWIVRKVNHIFRSNL